MFVGAQATENSISSTYTLHKIADYLPIIEKVHFSFLLSSFSFILLTLGYILHMYVLSVWIFLIMLAEISQNAKGSVPTWQTGSCSYRVLIYSCQAMLITFLIFCIGDLLSETQSLSFPLQACREWGDFLSDTETSLPRHCMMRVVHLSLQLKKLHGDLR